VRRTVFDGLGVVDRSTAKPIKLSDAARLDRQLSLVGESEVLPMFARIPEGFVIDRVVAALESARPAIAGAAALADKPDELSALFAKVTPLPSTLHELALARFAWSGVGDRIYIDRPQVLVYRQRLAAADFARRDELDIVANPVAVWPADTDPRAARIAQGVADTATEAVVLGCRTSAGCVRGINTSDRFAEDGAGWIVTAPGTSATLDHLPAGVRALATADLAAGYVVVAPPGAKSATWWRVHPVTGEVLGMGARGGITQAEYAVIQLNLVYVAGGIGCFVAAIMHGQTTAALVFCIAAQTMGVVAGWYALLFIRGFAVASLAIQVVNALFGTIITSS
jgi:hypothetical protein